MTEHIDVPLTMPNPELREAVAQKQERQRVECSRCATVDHGGPSCN